MFKLYRCTAFKVGNDLKWYMDFYETQTSLRVTQGFFFHKNHNNHE